MEILYNFSSYCLPSLKKQHLILTGSILALFGEVIMQILQPWPLKFVIDRITSSSSRFEGNEIFQMIETLDTTTLLIICAIGLVSIVALKALATYSNTVGFTIIGTKILTDVRNMLYRHIQCMSLSFHTKSRNGDIILRIMNDVNVLKEVSVTAFLPLLASVLILIGMFVVMFFLNWQLALIAFAIVPVFFFFVIKRSNQIHELARKQRKREGMMASTASESIGAIKDIQALSLGDYFSNSFTSHSNKTLTQDVRGKKLAAGLERTVDVLIAVASSIVLFYGGFLVTQNDLTTGELIVFLAYLGTAFRPLRNFAKYSGRIAKAIAACERVLEILEIKPDIYDLPTAIEAPKYNGDIKFQNVKFEYEPGNIILDNITFNGKVGQKICLLGISGSGKSTLVNLILRLYDCTEGKVLIDGKDIRGYKLLSHRNQISVLLQDNALFAASVKDNISFGTKNATQKEIEYVSQLANAHQFILQLPEGYDTVIGERGITLSKGQRQRIAIARAAIRKSPILILDEPTTGLDKKNEREIIEALDRLMEGRTTFLITHNLNHASKCDLILYLENGKIIEQGTHEELMKLDKYYASMYRIQEVR